MRRDAGKAGLGLEALCIDDLGIDPNNTSMVEASSGNCEAHLKACKPVSRGRLCRGLGAEAKAPAGPRTALYDIRLSTEVEGSNSS